MPALTLNIDLGELPGEPDELYALATQANVACGGHAGDEASMRRACRLANEHGAALAAHPSYPDREGFGRRSLAIEPAVLRASLIAQCTRLRAAAEAEGASVHRVKAHGALYHDVATNGPLAEVLVEAALQALDRRTPIEFVGATEGALASAVQRLGAGSIIAEAFADRVYDGEWPNAKLRPRTKEGALLTDPQAAAAQARSLARTGRFGTLCVHGDTPGAVAIARLVRKALSDEGLLR